MKIYRKTLMNGFELADYPFRREFELEGLLISNPELLSINDDDLQVSRLIGVEPFIRNGRRAKNGRADMLVSYEDGRIGIVELKRGTIDEKAYKQLVDYLAARKGLEESKALQSFKRIAGNEDLDLRDQNQYVGVLVGTDIDDEVITLLKDGKDGVPVHALTLKRYRCEDKSYFVFTNTYQAGGKDYTKYKIAGCGHEFCKSKLVLEVIRRYVEERKKHITYAELEEEFPKSLRGVKKRGLGCFARKEEAEELFKTTEFKRHYLEPENIIQLKDCEIAVCKEWGVGIMQPFLKRARKHFKISSIRENVK